MMPSSREAFNCFIVFDCSGGKLFSFSGGRSFRGVAFVLITHTEDAGSVNTETTGVLRELDLNVFTGFS